MSVTIATHNGSTVAREHNLRNKKVVSKEKHIDMSREHEVWHDENPREAYKHLFGKAMDNYNAKQSRPERKIKDYYKTVREDAKRHPVYEMIIGVYGKNECSAEQGKAIMQEFVDGWQERNPNLYLVGAYYHADEQGEPHVHIDYIPVAHGYTRGMETQNGLVKAFGEMGLEKKGRFTAQMQWEARENKCLECICISKGLSVEHPKEEARQHIDTAQYKAQMELTDAQLALLHAKEEKRKEEANTRLERANAEQAREKNKVATDELAKILKEKAEAAEIHHVFGNRDKRTYYGDMADKIYKVDENVRKRLQETQKTLENIATREKAVSAMERETVARNLDAQESYENAQRRELNQQRYIDEAVQKKIDEMFKSEDKSYTKRLEKFCQNVRYNNGRTVLDEFKQCEKERQRALEEEWER